MFISLTLFEWFNDVPMLNVFDFRLAKSSVFKWSGLYIGLIFRWLLYFSWEVDNNIFWIPGTLAQQWSHNSVTGQQSVIWKPGMPGFKMGNDPKLKCFSKFAGCQKIKSSMALKKCLQNLQGVKKCFTKFEGCEKNVLQKKFAGCEKNVLQKNLQGVEQMFYTKKICKVWKKCFTKKFAGCDRVQFWRASRHQVSAEEGRTRVKKNGRGKAKMEGRAKWTLKKAGTSSRLWQIGVPTWGLSSGDYQSSDI